ncbi:MAG TPA: hypothetical protein VGF40_01020 [Thermoanaerobaculia bacterium]
MTRDDRVHLLLRESVPTFPWELISLGHPIVAVRSLSLLKAAFLTGVEERHKEIVTVIFDRSTTHEDFLQFLCQLPPGFRGDVLMIEEGRTSFLASTTGDGRVLFRLEPADLDLYMRARFDVDDPAMLQIEAEESKVDRSGATLLAGSYWTN